MTTWEGGGQGVGWSAAFCGGLAGCSPVPETYVHAVLDAERRAEAESQVMLGGWAGEFHDADRGDDGDGQRQPDGRRRDRRSQVAPPST